MILLVPLVERYLHRANLLHAPDAIAVETTAVRVGLTEADHLALGIVTAVRVQPPSAHLPAISKRHAFAVGRAAATRLRVLHDEAGGAPARIVGGHVDVLHPLTRPVAPAFCPMHLERPGVMHLQFALVYKRHAVLVLHVVLAIGQFVSD